MLTPDDFGPHVAVMVVFNLAVTISMRGFDLTRSFVIGDRMMNVGMAHAVGAKGILVPEPGDPPWMAIPMSDIYYPATAHSGPKSR
jgi:hypothetical protein